MSSKTFLCSVGLVFLTSHTTPFKTHMITYLQFSEAQSNNRKKYVQGMCTRMSGSQTVSFSLRKTRSQLAQSSVMRSPSFDSQQLGKLNCFCVWLARESLNCMSMCLYLRLWRLHSISWCVSFQSEATRGKTKSSEGMLQPGHRRSLAPLYFDTKLLTKANYHFVSPYVEVQSKNIWVGR